MPFSEGRPKQQQQELRLLQAHPLVTKSLLATGTGHVQSEVTQPTAIDLGCALRPSNCQ